MKLKTSEIDSEMTMTCGSCIYYKKHRCGVSDVSTSPLDLLCNGRYFLYRKHGEELMRMLRKEMFELIDTALSREVFEVKVQNMVAESVNEAVDLRLGNTEDSYCDEEVLL